MERAGMPRSAAIALVGHETESIYRHYAITDEAVLRKSADKLAALHRIQLQAAPKVVTLASVQRTASE